MNAHKATRVEEQDVQMTVSIDRLGRRLLRCGVWRRRCLQVHGIRKGREWRDLPMRKSTLTLR